MQAQIENGKTVVILNGRNYFFLSFQRHDPFVSRMCLIQHAEIYIKASYEKIAKLAALQGCLAI